MSWPTDPTPALLCLWKRYWRIAIAKVKKPKKAPMMPKTMVIVRAPEAPEFLEPAAAGSTLAHGPSSGRHWKDEVDIALIYIRRCVEKDRFV
jgi:hypothetical protein